MDILIKWLLLVLPIVSNMLMYNGLEDGFPYKGLRCNIDVSPIGLDILKERLVHQRKFVALTFDDGPSKKRITDITKLLGNFDAKATFFVVGYRTDTKNQTVKDLHTKGFEIANHSWSHKNYTKLTKMEQFRDMKRTSDTIKRVIGTKVKWFRPPYGCFDSDVVENAKQLNMTSILWSVDSIDWRGDNIKTTINRVLDNIHNGAIILFHDHDNQYGTMIALYDVMKVLKERGYEFVTMSEWEKRICNLPSFKYKYKVYETKSLCNYNEY